MTEEPHSVHEGNQTLPLGRKLRYLRESAGVSLRKAAKKVGISPSYSLR
jgi:hypothetical protein